MLAQATRTPFRCCQGTCFHSSRPEVERPAVRSRPTSLLPWRRLSPIRLTTRSAMMCIALGLAGVGSAGAQAQWIELGPPDLIGHTAILDPIRDRMVVFGGYGPARNTTWVLSLSGGHDWRVLDVAGPLPEPRYRHTAIYDPHRNRMIVFGGVRSGAVWALTLGDSPTWSEITPTSGPSPGPRLEHVAAYDPVGDRMILHGGQDTTGTLRRDVWALSLSGEVMWSELAPSGDAPPPRYGVAAELDADRDRILMFGGMTQGNFLLSTTWALSLSDGMRWSVVDSSNTGPPPSYASTAVVDRSSSRLLIQGGTSTDAAWALTLAESPEWTQLTTEFSGPPTLSNHVAVWDPTRRRMIVHGRDETWALTLSGSARWSRWVGSIGEPPPPQSGHSAIYDRARRRMVLFAGRDDTLGSYSGVWALTTGSHPHWNRLHPANVPPHPRFDHAAVYDSARDRMIVCGGITSGDTFRVLNDVWTLSLGTSPEWHEMAVTGPGPTSLVGHCAIHDMRRDRMLVLKANLSLEMEVWELNLSGAASWSLLDVPGPQPPGSRRLSAVYDERRDRIVVFGGIQDSCCSDDVWQLSLEGVPSWTQLSPAGPGPAGRAYHTAVYLPRNDVMIVHGGSNSRLIPEGRDDTWALSFAPLAWTRVEPSGASPPGSYSHTAVADFRDRMIIWGGLTRGLRAPGAWELELPGGLKAWSILARPRNGLIDLAWETEGLAGRNVTVYRQRLEEPWSPIAAVTVPTDGVVRYVDANYGRGGRIAYRLGYPDGSNEATGEVVYIDAEPLHDLRLMAARNPSTDGVVVRLNLPGAVPSTLELFDVGGRSLVVRHLAAISRPVASELRLAERGALPSGIYFVRLSQGESSRTVRIALTE